MSDDFDYTDLGPAHDAISEDIARLIAITRAGAAAQARAEERADRYRLAWLSAWRGRAEARYDADVWRRLAGNKPKGAGDE